VHHRLFDNPSTIYQDKISQDLTNTYMINVEHREQDAMPDPSHFSPNSPSGQAGRTVELDE